MKLANARKRKARNGNFTSPVKLLRTRKSALLLSIVVGLGLLTVAVGAYSRGKFKVTSATLTPRARLLAPTGGLAINNLFNRLSLQPEADRFRRRLGQRFAAVGRERAVSAGVLTLGKDESHITIYRTQSDQGELVEIAMDSETPNLTWSPTAGVQAPNQNEPSGDERAMTERLALDSPDEFIHAQLRMASYYTIARNVMPADAGGSDTYDGPVWDIVRVTEPSGTGGIPLSPVRHYFFNSSTGLLEKVVSNEEGRKTVVAVLSDWSNVNGEMVPMHIEWSIDGEVVMVLTVRNFTVGPAE